MLCDALLEEGSLVLQSRLEPWREHVQAEASVTSRTEATAKPSLTLKQKKALVKEIPWRKLAELPEKEKQQWYDAAASD